MQTVPAGCKHMHVATLGSISHFARSDASRKAIALKFIVRPFLRRIGTVTSADCLSSQLKSRQKSSFTLLLHWCSTNAGEPPLSGAMPTAETSGVSQTSVSERMVFSALCSVLPNPDLFAGGEDNHQICRTTAHTVNALPDDARCSGSLQLATAGVVQSASEWRCGLLTDGLDMSIVVVGVRVVRSAQEMPAPRERITATAWCEHHPLPLARGETATHALLVSNCWDCCWWQLRAAPSFCGVHLGHARSWASTTAPALASSVSNWYRESFMMRSTHPPKTTTGTKAKGYSCCLPTRSVGQTKELGVEGSCVCVCHILDGHLTAATRLYRQLLHPRHLQLANEPESDRLTPARPPRAAQRAHSTLPTPCPTFIPPIFFSSTDLYHSYLTHSDPTTSRTGPPPI
ncbi:uncharacterized protein MYCFIDRAFT_179431 [Pseudocercospora fijiensis CIRAD86]|uniref:Uncharacterized protein n=1 Tax=Pseudocercospora fijiensis (strain CIRAD86) TaxID=383855 RepID=M3ALE2_PSEFD|nr:uncharacterized protein MYCFIDRAFT_179431 [Pseudocercospora fijiensis CIRAD86]EME77978.1 hypothetical protein MYCFIDRAFT_179431 [Pseudocercospora fijiensis CIRAD86]